jgi:NADH:ubiquinone oxidoreductase subunit F (NADH-binding)/Pyruvate/2-oxoacid:ferredoxin oxidoreductase delta subunit
VRIRSEQELDQIAEIGMQPWSGGRPRIAVGLSSCGLAAGAREVFAAFQKEAGFHGSSISPVATGCIGFCGAEPLVDIYVPGRGRVLCGPVTAADVGDMAAQIRQSRLPQNAVLGHLSPLLELDASFPAHLPALWEHPFYRGQVKRISRNLGQIDPASLEEYISRGGYRALAKALTTMSAEQIIEEVKRSGLRGRGGAGYPTGRKWELTRNAGSPPRFVIMNGDEGDPGAYMDRSLMEGDPHAVIEGMLIGGYAMGAELGVLYVRAEYPLAQERLNLAVRQVREAGLLGNDILGTGFAFDLRLVSGAGAFVSGEETALINAVEGRIAEPNPRPPYPAEKGLYGRPTCINNVETWANIPLIVQEGAEWFGCYGTEQSKGTKLFCLVGDVVRTGLVEVPLGTSLAAIVNDMGGGARRANVKALQTGGPSGGCIPVQAFDLPADYEHLQRAGTIMGSGGLVVLSERTCMVDVARYFLDFTRQESCGKCTSCREGTDHLGGILDRITRGEGTNDDLARLATLARGIMMTSLCGLGQTAPNPVLTSLAHFRSEYEAHVRERRCPAGVCNALLSFSIDPEACTGCALCVAECPAEAISGEKKQPHRLDHEKCVKCGACREVCAFDAVRAQ